MFICHFFRLQWNSFQYYQHLMFSNKPILYNHTKLKLIFLMSGRPFVPHLFLRMRGRKIFSVYPAMGVLSSATEVRATDWGVLAASGGRLTERTHTPISKVELRFSEPTITLLINLPLWSHESESLSRFRIYCKVTPQFYDQKCFLDFVSQYWVSEYFSRK